MVLGGRKAATWAVDDNPCVSRRNMQAGTGLKTGVVIAFNGYPEALLIIGGHVSGFRNLSVGVPLFLSLLPPPPEYQFGHLISKNE